MKNSIYTFFLTALFCVGLMPVFGQSYTVHPVTKVINENIDQSIGADMKFTIVNTGSSSLLFDWELVSTNVDTAGGLWNVQYCDPGNCVPWLPQSGTAYLSIAPGDSNLFKFTVLPGNPAGAGWLKYRISPQGLENWDTLTWNWDITIGIEDALLEQNTSVYPNPTNGTVILESRNGGLEAGNIEIFDLNGRTLKSIEVLRTSRMELNLSGLNEGMYFLRYAGEKGQFTRKIQKLN